MKAFFPDAGRFVSILETMLSTLNIEEILTTVVKDVSEILGVEKCTLYLLDRENNELYSKVLEGSGLGEISVPISKSSLAGYAATAGKTIKIKDAYDTQELQAVDKELVFDDRWDRQSGIRTRSVLTVPVRAKGEIIAVFQAINKTGGFSASDRRTMEQLTFLLGIAVSNCLAYRAIEEEKRFREYIIDDIEEGICILDTKKRIISGNSFLEVMSGMRYSRESMTGRYFFDIFPGLKDTEIGEKIDEVLACGFKKIALSEILETKIIPYLGESGSLSRVILIFTRI
ncbi:MAG: GAF domain-containing protein [Pseudomonadota bacterium]